jgi:hypothetical protein
VGAALHQAGVPALAQPRLRQAQRLRARDTATRLDWRQRVLDQVLRPQAGRITEPQR